MLICCRISAFRGTFYLHIAGKSHGPKKVSCKILDSGECSWLRDKIHGARNALFVNVHLPLFIHTAYFF